MTLRPSAAPAETRHSPSPATRRRTPRRPPPCMTCSDVAIAPPCARKCWASQVALAVMVARRPPCSYVPVELNPAPAKVAGETTRSRRWLPATPAAMDTRSYEGEDSESCCATAFDIVNARRLAVIGAVLDHIVATWCRGGEREGPARFLSSHQTS